MTTVNDWPDLPLFPLNTVLFPGMVLPLHIFEDRYKLMIGRCLDEERPFGVVLIREGKEVGVGAVPYEVVPYKVGTTAIIAQVNELETGRLNIITIGSERFRLRAVHHDLPYLVGHAEPWPLTDALINKTQQQVGPMRALLRQYLTLLAQAQGHKIEIEELSSEPRTLALTIAIALQLPMPQKQRLLAQPTVGQMLQAERVILRREQLLLDHIIQTQGEQWEGGYSGYLAKN
jgi:Lon protease-like protein